MAASTESSPLLGQSPSPPPRLTESSHSAASNKDHSKLVFSTVDQDKIPVWKKLTFAVGAMPYAMCNTVIGFYLNIFLLEVAILDPIYVLLIVFTGRVWDALTDPTIGFLCNRTRSPLGRLRPWLLGAMVPTALAYMFLWFVPPSFSHTASYLKFIYYILFYFAFQLLLTCIHVPYTSLTMHLSNSNTERDSATLFRMVFELLGTLVGIGVYTAYFSGFVQGKQESSCDGGVRERDVDLERTYRYHAVTLGVLTVVFITTTLVTIKEQAGMYSTKIGLFSGIQTVFSFRPYLLLFLIQLFGWLGITFVQGNYALYVKYALNLEALYPYVIAVLLVAAILWMPLWQLLMHRIGKKASLRIGLWIFMVNLLSLLFIDFAGDYGYIFIFPLSIIGGAGVAAGYLFPWSMLPDVIDEAYLKMGVRREELFYAFFVFGTKFSSGVTLGLSTGIYKAGGYDETKCDQPWTFPLTLKLLVTVPPIIFILIGLFCLHHYPISEKSIERTKKLLELRRRTMSQNSLITRVSTQSRIAPRTPTHNGGVVTVTNNRDPLFTDTQVSETTFSSS